MMKSLKLLAVLMVVLFSGVATANPLYSWTTEDGTPTYSPDPPPKGVSYVIVGANLEPLASQPAAPAAQPQSNSNAASGNLVLAPSPGGNNNAARKNPPTKSPSANWKPVIYADDPNPTGKKQAISAAALAPDAASIQPPPTAQSAATQSVSRVSEHCFKVRRQVILLESQFANALSAEQMDDAIVQLNVFRNEHKGNCGL